MEANIVELTDRLRALNYELLSTVLCSLFADNCFAGGTGVGHKRISCPFCSLVSRLSIGSSGAHLPELHGEHGHERNRPLHADAAEEGGGRRDGTHALPRHFALPVDQTQQPLLYLFFRWNVGVLLPTADALLSALNDGFSDLGSGWSNKDLQ